MKELAAQKKKSITMVTGARNPLVRHGARSVLSNQVHFPTKKDRPRYPISHPMAQSDRTLSATPKRQVLRNVSMQSGMGEAVQAGLAEVERVVLAEIYA